MKFLTRLSKIFTDSWVLFIIILIFDILIISAIYAIARYSNNPVDYLTRDPGQVTGDVYIGFLSNLGIMLWAAAAACCYIGAILLWRFPTEGRFFLASALLTTLLGLDDAFMFHEGVFPRFLHLSERQVYYGYLFILLIYFFFFTRNIIKTSSYPLFILSILFFGVSIFFDLFLSKFPTKELEAFIEDGAKFFGITFWLAYFMSTNIKMILPRVNANKIEV